MTYKKNTFEKILNFLGLGSGNTEVYYVSDVKKLKTNHTRVHLLKLKKSDAKRMQRLKELMDGMDPEESKRTSLLSEYIKIEKSAEPEIYFIERGFYKESDILEYLPGKSMTAERYESYLENMASWEKSRRDFKKSLASKGEE